MLLLDDKAEPTNLQKLKTSLERGDEYEKIKAMQELVLFLLHGGSAPQLLVPVIRFVMPHKSHKLKKLVLLYLEVVDKRDERTVADGTMLLVCNALLRDLQYPNEYVRGSAMRFLCTLKEPDLLIPLVESVVQNLSHKYALPLLLRIIHV